MIDERLLEAAVRGDEGPLKSLPKGDLHVHAMLSAPFEVYHRLSGGKTRRPPLGFRGLSQFLSYVDLEIVPVIRSAEICAEILDEALKWMAADGVVYTELSYPVGLPSYVDSSWDVVIDQLGAVVSRWKGKITVFPELGLARETDPEFWKSDLPEALETGFFRGVDLYGDEKNFEIELFDDYFAAARAKGLKVKLHTGETGDAYRMLREVKYLFPDGVQHGIAAAESESAIQFLKENRIEVNICPASNIALSLTGSYSAHPVRRLFDGGVRVTLGSDDYGVFGKTLSDQYLEFYKEGVFSAAELDRIRCNSLAPLSRIQEIVVERY